MRTLVLAASTLAAAAAGAPAHAQGTLSAGQSTTGSLGPSSPRADGAPYALHTLRGRPGERLRVTLSSEAFDALLAVGVVAAPTCENDCRMNDDGGGGTNSRLTYTLGPSGQAQIRAGALGGDAAGAYVLRVEAAPPAVRPTARTLALNVPQSGELGESSPRDDDDKAYDIWVARGRPGQKVVIRVESQTFDPMVGYGVWANGMFTQMESDDDSGPGVNARLNVTLGSTGEAAIKVMGLSNESAGAYSVSIGDPPVRRPIVARAVAVGEAVRGVLDDQDPFTPDDEERFDVYEIKGRPGQRVIARMESSAFDPILRWGVFEGETLAAAATDDDGGGGTSAQLVVTLDEDGVGRLVATGLGGGVGAYTLSLVGAPRPAR